MPPRSNPAPAPAVEKSPKNVSRLELAALAHKNAVEERKRFEVEVAEARRKLDALNDAFNEANSLVIETAKQLTAAALGKPE